MSYRTHCDWCGEHLSYEDDQAIMPVTIYHRRGKGALDAKWAEEVGVTRHFCAAPKAEDGRRQGSGNKCYDRAIAAIKGTVVGDPGMGMEWRLVPVGGEEEPVAAAEGDAAPVATPPTGDPADVVVFDDVRVTRELHEVLTTRLPPKRRGALPKAGVVSLDQVAVMSDDELLAIDGIGRGSVRRLREAVADRDCDGTALARKVYELLQAGLPRLGDEDPLRPVLADALPSLAAALGEPAA
jgi:hypothetical protein